MGQSRGRTQRNGRLLRRRREVEDDFEATVNGRALTAGDALLYQDEPRVTIARGSKAEVLVFDLPEINL